MQNNSVASLGFISRFDLPNMVPLGGRLTFAEVAQKTGFTESVVARLMRDAMTRRIFAEPDHGVIAHTKTSKALRQPWLLAFVRAGAEEGWSNMFKVRRPAGPARRDMANAAPWLTSRHRSWMLWSSGPPARSPVRR